MAKLTGRIIKEKYAPGKRTHVYCGEQKCDKGVGREYITNAPEIIYYINKKTGNLCSKETMLLW